MPQKLKNKSNKMKNPRSNQNQNILKKEENSNKNFKKKSYYLNKLKSKNCKSCTIEEQPVSIVPNQKEEKLFFEMDQVDRLYISHSIKFLKC